MAIMSMFGNITKTSLKDCIESEGKLIFIVPEGMAGKAIGKQGANIKTLENRFKKRVRVIEYNNNLETFIANVVYPSKIKEIQNTEDVWTIIPADSYQRGILIGRNAVNLRESESIVKRYFTIKELKVA